MNPMNDFDRELRLVIGDLVIQNLGLKTALQAAQTPKDAPNAADPGLVERAVKATAKV